MSQVNPHRTTAVVDEASSAGAVHYVRQRTSMRLFVLLIAVHVPLALVMERSEMASTLHAAATFAAGLWWVANGQRNRVAFTGAYIVGAEVLWRMTGAHVFWEFGKYGVAVLFLLALVRARRISAPLLGLLFFALLIPSLWVTVTLENWETAREFISFNLSGPFALFVCAWFFYHVRLSAMEMRTLLLSLIAPVAGVLSIAIHSTVTASATNLFFSDANFATSGGYGPNQVSSMLGLAGLFCFFSLLIGRMEWRFRVIVIVLAAAFFVQSALTFSRSGLALALGGVMVAAFFLFNSPQARAKMLLLIGVFAALSVFVVIPRLESFTNDALSERFSSTTSSGRIEIAEIDLILWQRHPILGVGPGRGVVYRERLLDKHIAAHTEFSRLLAEHGVFGLLSITLLFVACWINFIRAGGSKERAVIAALITWGMLFMLINAFRLAAPAFTIGLTFAHLFLNDSWRVHFQNRVNLDVAT